MGDRCYLQINMAEKDQDIFTKEVNKLLPGWGNDIWALENTCDGVFTGTLYEVNYGWYTELKHLAQVGFKFHGFQGAGSDYGSAMFSVLNKKVYYAFCQSEGEIMVPINLKTFQPDIKSVLKLEKYVEGRKQVEKYIEESR